MSYVEPSSEDEEELIEKTAKMVVDAHMETAAIMFLQYYKPFSLVGGDFGRFFIGPFLPSFGDLGDMGNKLFYVFEKIENIGRLIERIEELTSERKKLEKNEKEKIKIEKKKKSLLKSILQFLNITKEK